MKKSLFLILSLFVLESSLSQTKHVIDSLKTELVNLNYLNKIKPLKRIISYHTYDSDTVFKYLKILEVCVKRVNSKKENLSLNEFKSSVYSHIDLKDSAFYYCNKVINNKEIDNYREIKTKSLFTFATLKFYDKKYDASISYSSKILKEIQYLEDTIKYKYIALSHIVLAHSLHENGNYNKSISIFYKLLAYGDSCENITDKKSIVENAYMGLSVVFLTLNDTINAKKYALKMVEEYEKYDNYKNRVFYANALTRLGNVENDLVKKLDYYLKSLNNSSNRKVLNGLGCINVSNTYIRLEKYDSAYIYLNKAKSLLIKTKDLNMSYKIQLLEAVLEDKFGNYTSSIIQYEKCLLLLDKFEQNNNKEKLLKRLAELYSLKRNYFKAYEYKIKYHDLKDSLFNEKKHKQIAELEIKYETEKKQNEIKELALKNDLSETKVSAQKNKASFYLFGGLGTLLLISLGGLLFYKQRKNRFENEQYKLEQKLLRTQLNPHFMSNFLMAIQTSVHKDKPEVASKNVSKFGRLNRQVLEASRNDYILLEDEIGFLKNYLDLQLVLTPNKFKYNIELHNDIDESELSLPPMLIQPFIENSIEHAFVNIKNGGEINIDFKIANNNLLINISDNGLGREATKVKTTDFKHTSHATKITEERIALFKRKWNKSIKFDIKDLQIGTTILFQIPLST